MRTKQWIPVVFAMIALVSAVAPARADITTFILPAGSTTSGGMVAAEADITTGAGTVTVVLKDLVVNPASAAQCLSALTLTFSNAVGANSLTSSSGQERSINSDGTFTDGGTVATGWLESSTTNTLKVDDLGGAGPAHTIVGAPGPGNLYSNANSSIIGGTHNPHLNQTATFVFSAAGVTANTHITGAMFQFGTTDGSDTVTGGPVTVPEPSTLSFALVSMALAGAGAAWRRHRARKATLEPTAVV
jgi:hypothetical protein